MRHWQAIARSPGRALDLLMRKLALYFNDYEVPDNQDMYFFSRYSWVLRFPLIGFGIVFALGLAGMLLLRQRPLTRVSLIVFFAVYGLSVVVFYVFSRYRLPSLPALLPFAGEWWSGSGTAIATSSSRMLKLQTRILRLATSGVLSAGSCLRAPHSLLLIFPCIAAPANGKPPSVW